MNKLMKSSRSALYFLALIAGIFLTSMPDIEAHHYKGLPHYSYFDNYPQIPYLEFIKMDEQFETFITVYNFQGLNLEQVDSPDDVRLYVYLYDLEKDKVFKGEAAFEIYSHDQLIRKIDFIPPEQENIFVIQGKIKEQDRLSLKIKVKKEDGQLASIEIPFQITETFFEKYGLALGIFAFFVTVALIKKVSMKQAQVKKNMEKKKVSIQNLKAKNMSKKDPITQS